MMSDDKTDKPLADIPLGIPNLGVVIPPPAKGSEGASDNDAEEQDDEVTPKNGNPDSSPPR